MPNDPLRTAEANNAPLTGQAEVPHSVMVSQIEAAVLHAKRETARRCAMICRERAELFGMGSDPWDEAMNCYDAIRKAFGLTEAQNASTQA
jgi:hypothetical protein